MVRHRPLGCGDGREQGGGVGRQSQDHLVRIVLTEEPVSQLSGQAQVTVDHRGDEALCTLQPPADEVIGRLVGPVVASNSSSHLRPKT
jgi:hypothetical protein